MDERPVLKYANRQPSQRIGWWVSFVWLGSSTMIWRFADWGVYVGSGPTRWRKFEMPLLFQVGMSLFQGSMIAAAVYAVYLIGRRCDRHISRSRGTGPRIASGGGQDAGAGRLIENDAAMGHRLFPIIEGMYLEPEEIAHRLRAEFRFVDADRNAGASEVERAIREFRKRNAPEELLDEMRRRSLKAIRIIVSDRTRFDQDYLEFIVTPSWPPYVPYRSKGHMTAAAPLLSKVCKVLGYRAEVA